MLLGQSLLVGDITSGFISLFVFGLTLTVPLIAFALYERGMSWLGALAQKSGKISIGTVDSVCLSLLKALFSSGPHIQGVSFLSSQDRGFVILAYSLMNLQ